jgi:hypothetical protein
MLVANGLASLLQLGLFCLAAVVLLGGLTGIAVWRILRTNKPVFLPLGPRLTVQSGRGGLKEVAGNIRSTLGNRDPEIAAMRSPAISRNQIALRLNIHVVNESDQEADLKFWETFQGPELTMHLGDLTLAAKLFAYYPRLGCLWVVVDFEGEAEQLLRAEHIPVRFRIDHAGYRQESDKLGPDMRKSLKDQLTLSREGEPA